MAAKVTASYNGSDVEVWTADLLTGYFVALNWPWSDDGPMWLTVDEAYALSDALLLHAADAKGRA